MLVLWVGLGGASANAEDQVPSPSRARGSEQTVTSNGAGLRVRLTISGDVMSVDLRWDDGRSSSSGEDDCTYRLVEIPEASFSLRDAGEPPSESARPFWIYCGGARQGATWVDDDDVIDFDEVARTGAEEYVRDVLGPGLSVGTNPASYGVVGMATWNWVEGWDGQPIAVPTISAFGNSVDITLRLQSATWDFGDGTGSHPGDLGRVYPAESTVRHNYTHRSTSPAEPDGTYTVAATATISATYRLNGGPEVAVDPPLTATASSPVIIRQAQAVLS